MKKNFKTENYYYLLLNNQKFMSTRCRSCAGWYRPVRVGAGLGRSLPVPIAAGAG
jgi:hypothetical protein